MTSIGLFGGGSEEERYLQLLKYRYYVLDEEDITSILDYRIFKLLIFPSRFELHSKKLYDKIRNNNIFTKKIEDFLRKGGKIILFPPIELPSDFQFCKYVKKNSIKIDWLPIYRLKFTRKNKASVIVKKSNHPLIKNIKKNSTFERYGYFDFTDIPIYSILCNSKGKSLLAEIKIGSGSIIAGSMKLDFHNIAPQNARRTTEFFRNLIQWGLNTITYSICFDNIVDGVSKKYGRKISNLLRKADQKILDNDFINGCEYAFKAFELIIIEESNHKTNLYGAINIVFPKTAKIHNSKPENTICHSIRYARNSKFHAVKTDDEIIVEEVEYFLSAIKYIIRILL